MVGQLLNVGVLVDIDVDDAAEEDVTALVIIKTVLLVVTVVAIRGVVEVVAIVIDDAAEDGQGLGSNKVIFWVISIKSHRHSRLYCP